MTPAVAFFLSGCNRTWYAWVTDTEDDMTQTTLTITRFPGLTFTTVDPAEMHRPADDGRLWVREVRDTDTEPVVLEARLSEVAR